MADEKSSTTVYAKKVVNNSSAGGAIYGLGIFGALVYYLQHATSFWDGIVGILMAIFWPAVILYKVLELLKL